MSSSSLQLSNIHLKTAKNETIEDVAFEKKLQRDIFSHKIVRSDLRLVRISLF